MAMTAAEYRDLLLALAPPGTALPGEPDSTWGRLLQALADELARVDARADDLIDEADPRTTYELLADWERVAGLPDPCVPEGQTVTERRNALVGRLTATGGQSRQYFIDLAASLGYSVTITEFRPQTVDDSVDAPIYGQDWAFAWQVNAPQTTVTYHTVDGDVAEPLANWGNELLECVLGRYKPAHTHLIFSYA